MGLCGSPCGTADNHVRAHRLEPRQIIGPQDPDEPKVDSPWQAGTCTADPCSIATPGLFFEGAAGHPTVGFTQFIVNTEEKPIIGDIPIGNLRTVRVDLPRGLTVNPQATEQCDLEPGESPSTCPPGSKVGTSAVKATNQVTGLSLEVPPVDVFNIVPEEGEAARFGFSVLGNDVFLEAGVAWEGDYHEFFTIHVAKLGLGPGFETEIARIARNRLVFDGTAGDGTFITTPTTCRGEATPGSPLEHIYSTLLRADSYEEEDRTSRTAPPSSSPRSRPGPRRRNAASSPTNRRWRSTPETAQTDSPSGAVTTVEVPHITGGGNQESSQTRRAEVTLPAGMGLNPSAANGLEACTDAQFGKGTRTPGRLSGGIRRSAPSRSKRRRCHPAP